MNDSAHDSESHATLNTFRPLRLWPAVVVLLLMLACRLVPRFVDDESMLILMASVIGPVVGGGLLLLWWLLASRAAIRERLIGLLGVVAAAGITVAVIDQSMLGPALMIITAPMGFAAFGLAAILFGRWLSFNRTIAIILFAACGFGVSALMKSEGMWGDYAIDWNWRWESTAEERLLAERSQREIDEDAADMTTSEVEIWLANPEWPGFRGPDRDSVQHGEVFSADWSAAPPEQLWKITIGPGWSSFAVAGSLLFTQEQRGPNESVICYDAESGKEIWVQEIESRFYEQLGGVGPRATPTLADGALYVQGASGQLQRLDAKTGDVVWEQDLRKVANRNPPTWGFSASPLIVGSVVIVHAGGKGDKGTLAFERETGELQWSAPAGDHSYSSAQLETVVGKDVVLMMTNAGIRLLDPVDGAVRLNHEWKADGYRSVQPRVIDGDSILLSGGQGLGTRRIRVREENGGLTAEELWTKNTLKPDFNDYVIHDGHAYGFDQKIMACIDLESGDRKWKGGRYGKGQVLLLADSRLLLVAAEEGDVVLLKADPSGHREMAKFKALEGRTWNHPVVVGDRLYIRNAEEAACYRLPLAATQSTAHLGGPQAIR